MASNSVSIAWFLPFMALAPIGLAACLEATEMQEPADGGQTKAPPDGGQKTAGDSGMKTEGDSG
jgi:hypothetical protein